MASYLWLLSGHIAPAGYLPAGVVSRWQDTGAIRAELWMMADPFDDVRPGAAQPPRDEPTGAPNAERLLAASGRKFSAIKERNP